MSSILDSLFGKKQATEGKPLLNKKSPEVLQFKTMVEEINNSEKVMQCVDYYITRFANFYDKEGLLAGDIKHEVTKLIELYRPIFVESLNEKVKYIYGMAFLERAACLYHSDNWEKHNLLEIMYDILNTNNDEVIEDALPYVKEISSDKALLRIIFAGQHIVTFWKRVIMKESKVNKQIAEMFIEAAFKQTDLILLQIREFLDHIIQQIYNDEVPEEMLPIGLHLVGSLIANMSPEQYLSKIFNVLEPKLQTIVSYEWFSGFLITKSLDQNLSWQKFQFVTYNKQATVRQLCTAIDALYFVKSHPRVRKVDLIPFTKILPQMPFPIQAKYYDIAKNHDLKERIIIFMESYPFWEKNINTEALCDMIVAATWGPKGYKELVSVIDSMSYDPLVAALIKDVHTFNIIAAIFSHLDPEWEKINLFLERILEGTLEESRHPQEIVKIVLPQFDPHVYIETIKKYFDKDVMNVAVLDLLAEYGEISIDFAHVFCETGGLDKLTRHLTCPSTLDIIKSFVREEPYNLVDEYISRTDFSHIPKDQIQHTMCGIWQHDPFPKSQFIRIPSLCKYVQPMLDYAYNRYIYGKYAPLYFTPAEEDIFESSRTYMNSEIAAKFMTSPKSISYLIQNMEPCTGVYQLNHDCPKFAHKIHCEGVTSFWIFVHKFEGKSTMFKIDDRYPVFFDNGNICLHKSALPLKFKTWYLITFQLKIVDEKPAMSVYIDNEELRTVETESQDITLGGDSAPNGHWYLGEFYQSRVTMTTKYLNEQMEIGPSKVQKKLNCDFVYVPYAGPLSYLPAFGGPDTFWSACFNSHNIDEFLELILAAFSLERSKIITTNDLFNGISACFLQVPELMTEQTAQIAVMESMKQLRTTSPMLTKLFQNYFFVNAPEMSHQLFLSTYGELKDPVSILPYLTDSIAFFNVNGAKLENMLEAIGMIMKKKPAETIKFLLDVIRGIPYISSDKVETPDDPRTTEIQVELMRRVFGAGFPKTAEECIEPFDTLSACVAPFVFNGFVKNSVTVDGFYNKEVLNKMHNALLFYADKEIIWTGIFSLINNQVLKKLSDFKTDLLARPEAVILAFDLASELLKKDLKGKLAFTVLTMLLSIEKAADTICPDLHKYIGNLCAAGFHYYEKNKIPFSTSEDKNVYDNNDPVTDEKIMYSNEADFVDIDDYKVDKTEIERVPRKEDEAAQNIDGSADICRLIADISSVMLNLKCNDSNLFKDLLIKFTIQGADVPSPVAKEMHIFLVYDFLLTKPKLNDQSKTVLCNFIATVMTAGWWKNYEQPLCFLVFDYLPPEPVNFLTTCMIAIKSARIIIKIMQTPFAWKKAQKSKNFMDILAEKLINLPMTPEQEKIFLKEIGNPIKKAFVNKELEKFMTNDRIQSAAKLKQETLIQISQFNQEIVQKRIQNTLRTPTTLFEVSRNGNAFLHRISLRNQFITRFNLTCIGAEENISHVFQTRCLLQYFNLNDPGRQVISNSPSPIFPAKNILPLPKETEKENSNERVNLNFRDYFTLPIEFKALADITLPPYMGGEQSANRTLSQHLETDKFIELDLISAGKLPCIGAFAEDRFVFIVNAKLTEKGIQIIHNDDLKSIVDISTSALMGRSSLFFHNPALHVIKKEITYVKKSQYNESFLVDVFLFDGRHFAFGVDEKLVDEFVEKLKPEKVVIPEILSKKPSDIIDEYAKGTITALDLIFYANYHAGKTFSDLSNYPIFPLINADGTVSQTPVDKESRLEFVKKVLSKHEPFKSLSGAEAEESRKSAMEKADKSGLTPEFYVSGDFMDNKENPGATLAMRRLLETSDIHEWVDSVFGPEASTRVFETQMKKKENVEPEFSEEIWTTVLVPQPEATRVKANKEGAVFLTREQFMLEKARDINDFVVEHSLKNISALTVSEDFTSIAAATEQGTALVYFDNSKQSKLITCPQAVMTAMALDTRSNSLIATDGKFIYLFDIPSAVLSKKISAEGIIAISLMPVEEILIAVTSAKILVFTADVMKLAEFDLESAATCLAPIEGAMFEEKPRFIIGFQTGEVSAFEFNTAENIISKVMTYQKEGSPIKSVTSLHHGKAVISLDTEGGATSFTAHKCPRFADVSLFIKCTSCEKEAAWLCRDCGRAFCRGCLAGGKCSDCRHSAAHFNYFNKPNPVQKNI